MALSLPGALVMTLIGGALFVGLWWGSLLACVASSIGATAAFLAARFLFRDWVQSRFGERVRRLLRLLIVAFPMRAQSQQPRGEFPLVTANGLDGFSAQGVAPRIRDDSVQVTGDWLGIKRLFFIFASNL
ncbi:MAG: VTT domain-containing protein [Chromatiaceae bacterium]|nr:VTT domain-containing protein [Chromatiaceae bacterium]